MNEGMHYSIDDNNEELIRASRERRKARILHLITKSGFLSHMELVALHNNQKDTSEEDLSVTKSALIELQRSGEIKSAYTVTDQQNVIIGYELAEGVG